MSKIYEPMKKKIQTTTTIKSGVLKFVIKAFMKITNPNPLWIIVNFSITTKSTMVIDWKYEDNFIVLISWLNLLDTWILDLIPIWLYD